MPPSLHPPPLQLPGLPGPWEPLHTLVQGLGGPLELRGQAALCEIVVFPSPRKGSLVVPPLDLPPGNGPQEGQGPAPILLSPRGTEQYTYLNLYSQPPPALNV